MREIYKYNVVVFTAVLVALMFCVPLLCFEPAKAKAVNTASKVVSSSLKIDAIDAKLRSSGLFNVKSLGENFIYEQRYGTANNFTGSKIYKSQRVYLRKETADKLAAANKEFNSMGYRIKIWDAYRPYSVQVLLYKKVSSDKKLFIANPYKKESCVHNRGAAVDITLVHMDGSPVEMPTDFDNFTYSAYIKSNCTKQAAIDRSLLRTVMQRHGFTGIDCEWWHFNDSDAWKYSIIDVMF